MFGTKIISNIKVMVTERKSCQSKNNLQENKTNLKDVMNDL